MTGTEGADNFRGSQTKKPGARDPRRATGGCGRMNPPPIATREIAREERFSDVWTQQLDVVFADVAPYYDRANNVASLGLWNWFLSQFMSTIAIHPNERVLDVSYNFV